MGKRWGADDSHKNISSSGITRRQTSRQIFHYVEKNLHGVKDEKLSILLLEDPEVKGHTSLEFI